MSLILCPYERDHSDESGQTSFCLVEDDISSPNLYYQSRQALSLPLSPRLSLAACLMHCWVQLVEFVTFILSVNVNQLDPAVHQTRSQGPAG